MVVGTDGEGDGSMPSVDGNINGHNPSVTPSTPDNPTKPSTPNSPQNPSTDMPNGDADIPSGGGGGGTVTPSTPDTPDNPTTPDKEAVSAV